MTEFREWLHAAIDVIESRYEGVKGGRNVPNVTSLKTPLGAFVAARMAFDLAWTTHEKVALFTNGVDPRHLIIDTIFHRAGVAVEKLDAHAIEDDEFERLVAEVGHLAPLNVVMNDTPVTSDAWDGDTEQSGQEAVRHAVVNLDKQRSHSSRALHHLRRLATTQGVRVVYCTTD